MDSTPASHRSRTKLVSRLARPRDLEIEAEGPPKLSLDLVNSPSSRKIPSPSNMSLRSSTNSLPLQELLLLSPSPYKRSKTRLADRLEMANDENVEPVGARKRCKSRGSHLGLPGCGSPRTTRRSRRRPEAEAREERESGFAEEMVKPRRRRNSGRSRKEKLTLVPLVTSSSSLSRLEADEGFDNVNIDLIGEAITDLIMWRDAAKSTLWFGLGSLCFLSSCFAKGINFSIFTAVCQLGLLFLGLSFFSNSISQRNNAEKRRDLRLREEDILRAARLILPAANLTISKTRELFSGEPSTTLKVAPFLLLGAEYGHLLTMWRLCAIGFFMSFTVPKLYSRYCLQINQKVESVLWWVLEKWCVCSHKKMVAASATMAFWNLSTVKARILTAFISVVILRYCRQNSQLKLGGDGAVEKERLGEQQLQQALVVAE
ncbi:reticulon-like protein B17 [Punica granatum]|uniref:Reticulon-like protein n=2 Tax=Punica granatum TaxID=22663 RepID=A0A2I0J532_PUNGR|nr:reticulon-like protein B17 [Punica granatum]PKI51338.1 hypothetical protein CRG98_028285 [Punica granatum]